MRRHSKARRTAVSVVVGLAAAAASGILVGCGSGDTDPASTGGQVGAARRTATSAPDGTSALGGTSTSTVDVVAAGLDAPWGLAFLPDGSALVGERDSGRVLRLAADGAPPTEVMRLPSETDPDEGGLLGLAVSPDYATDGLVYAYYTADNANQIVRFRLGAPDGEVEEVLGGMAAARIHNGGRIAFGPDGMLYAGVGDAANPAASQNLNSRNGKILRMNPDGSVPPDNPFPNSLVYSLGHRNVQGLDWDSGGRLWATEFGQNTFDEVNLISPGANYGWPEAEGVSDDAATGFANPLVTWTTDEASPSGAAVVDDTLYVAALRGMRLWQVALDGNGGVAGEPTVRLDGYGRIRTVEHAPDGTLWVVTSNTDGRGEAGPDDDQILSVTVS